MRPAIAVDVGGTKTAVALVAPDGGMSGQSEAPTPGQQGPDAILDTVAGLVAELLDGENGEVAGIGIGTAGVVDTAGGRIVSSTDTMRRWAGTDVGAGIRARLEIGPETVVVVHNDVDAHALGEAWLGAARMAASTLLVAVGTGIGGAIVLDGKLWSGSHHAAGEIGHIPVPGAEGLMCPCGRQGHLEALASGVAIARRYGTLTGVQCDTREVIERAEARDPAACRTVDTAASGLGRAIAGLVTAIDPGCVVVGGGLAASGPRWWDPMVTACRAELIDVLAQLPIVRAELGPAAALFGAARAVFDVVEAAPTEGVQRS